MDWRKENIRKLVEENYYLDMGKHEDLKAICVCPDEESFEVDYSELTFIVPKKWLQEICMEKFNVPKNKLNKWLKETYTSDESEIILEEAIAQRKVVMLDF